MNDSIIIAMISGLCVAIPTLVTTLVTNSKNNILQDERIKNINQQIVNLTESVSKHNNFGLKIVELETKITMLEQKLK